MALRLEKLDTSTRIPRRHAPSYRNASPSGPWPWIDIDADIDEDELSPVTPYKRGSLKWSSYPSNLFPNWTPQVSYLLLAPRSASNFLTRPQSKQVQRSGIQRALDREAREQPCTIYHVDVLDTGKFKRPGELFITEDNKEELWEILENEVSYVSMPRNSNDHLGAN